MFLLFNHTKGFLTGKKAFTVIEILTVVIVIVILIAVVAPSFLGQQDKVYNSETRHNLAVLYKDTRADFTENDGFFTSVHADYVGKLNASNPQIPFTNTSQPATGNYGICKLKGDEVILVGKGQNDTSFTMTTNDEGLYIIEEGECVNYASEVLADSPWSYWRFNSGQLLADSSGNNRPLISMGAGVSSVAGPVTTSGDDSALKFAAGANTSANGAYTLTTQDYTLEAWVRIDSQTNLAANSTPLRMYGVSGGTQAIRMCGALYPGCTAMNVYPEVGGNYITAAGSLINPTPTFHHYVLTYSSATSTVDMYTDGVLTGTAVVAPVGTITASFFTITPSFGTPTQDSFTVDEVAIYDKALTMNRVQAHYDARSSE